MKTVDLELMSDYIIAFCQYMGVKISPLKIQKLGIVKLKYIS